MRFAISCDENPGDPGTMAGGLNERDENIKVATFLKAALQRCHQDAWFDDTITNVQRVAKANSDGTNVLVACAHNAVPDPSAEGTVFIFCPPGGRQFGKQLAAAENIGNELVRAGIASKWGMVDEQVIECCRFQRDTVYCELLFQTNLRDLARMKQPGYHRDAAEAMCRGLAKTYEFAYVPVEGGITWASFTGSLVAHPTKVYDGPSSHLHPLLDLADGGPIAFDAWMRGETQTDLVLNTPDNRWFHRKAGGGWLASAWIDGNPPDSTPV